MDDNIEREKFRAKLRVRFDLTLQKLIAFRKYKSTSFVFERNGNIVEMSAEELESEMNESKKRSPIKKKMKSTL